MHLSSVYDPFPKANNKGADQTVRMRRLVCACVVRQPPKTGFFTSRPIYGCGGGHLGHVAKFIQNDSGHMTKMVTTTSIYGKNH